MTNYTPEPKDDGALPLNEKISRIAQSLADTSLGKPSELGAAPDDIPEKVARAAVRAWRERGHYLPSELFSDPAWGMMLELFHAEVKHVRMSISGICTASAASTTTAIRWLNALESHGLVIRRADPDFDETEFVELTPTGSAALRSYFREVVQQSAGPDGKH